MKNLTLALRVLLKNKFYSLLNILGLAVGLAVAVIIFLYVQSDLSFDKQHENHANIYRIDSKFNIGGKNDEYALSSQFLPQFLMTEYPEIQNYTRLRTAGKVLIRSNDDQFYEDDLYYADSSMFSLFTHEFIEGDPTTALDEARSMVMTESLAKKYFGNSSPMGEILKTDNNQFKVTGVIKDLPDNVHLKFEGLLSYATLEVNLGGLSPQQKQGALWGASDFNYLLFPPNYDTKQLDEKFPDFYEKYMAPIAKLININGSFAPKFTPLADIHFNSTAQFDLPTGNKNYTYAFSAIGIFILLLAVINYANLASARATSRSKEVGVRKVMGSTKGSLVAQFLSESIIIALISMILAFGLVAMLVNGIGLEGLLGRELVFQPFQDMSLLFGSIGITLIIGLISGMYPAFYLSAISTVKALKGSVKSGPGSMNMRKAMVAFQFFISIGVIISTLLMKDQIEFLNDKDLGFNKDNVIIVPIQDATVNSKSEAIKNTLLENPGIIGVTDAIAVGGDTNLGNNLLGAGKTLVKIQGSDSILVDDTFPVLFVGDDYLKTMQVELLTGRDFDKSKKTDETLSVLVNEAMVEKMGWADPIGRRMSLPFPGATEQKVIGVVKDFNAFSLHSAVEPTVIFHKNVNPFLAAQAGVFASFHVHVRGDALKDAMAHLEQTFREQDTTHPFEYRFLDTRAEDLYREDTRQSQLTGILSYICIFISCLGLLGLASFSTSQRIKEIGVRKVLGASTFQLVYMIFRDVLVLIVIGFIISIPVSYYVINQWLQEFAYKMPLAQTLALAALLSGILAVIVAFITVSYHSLRAASQNPVKALRYE